MLVLARKRGQTLVIGDEIEITVVDIQGDQIRLGVDAPKNVRILRKELYQEIQDENKNAARMSGAIKAKDLGGALNAALGLSAAFVSSDKTGTQDPGSASTDDSRSGSSGGSINKSSGDSGGGSINKSGGGSDGDSCGGASGVKIRIAGVTRDIARAIGRPPKDQEPSATATSQAEPSVLDAENTKSS